MAIRLRHIAALAFVPFALSMGAAQAAGPYAGSCGEQLDAVEAAINATTFYEPKASSNKTNLMAKLDSAAAKLKQRKPLDAIANLDGISDKATEWATAQKPKIDDATGINYATAVATTCVGDFY